MLTACGGHCGLSKSCEEFEDILHIVLCIYGLETLNFKYNSFFISIKGNIM